MPEISAAAMTRRVALQRRKDARRAREAAERMARDDHERRERMRAGSVRLAHQRLQLPAAEHRADGCGAGDAPTVRLVRRGVLDVESRHGEAVVRLRGDIDLAARPMLDEAVTALLVMGAVSVTVDWAQVDFVDATGVNFLVRLRAELAATGATVSLRHPSAGLLRLLRLTDLVGLFPVQPLEVPGRAIDRAAAGVVDRAADCGDGHVPAPLGA